MIHRYKLANGLALILTLAGCNEFAFGPEAKINAAMPLSSEIVLQKSALLNDLDSSKRSTFDTEWGRRMKLRALNCAKGFTPPWYATSSSTREKLTDHACFKEHDIDIAKWIGFQRIGVLLAKPALKPIPATHTKFLVGEDSIKGFSFASEAGVVMLGGQKESALIVDLQTGQVLYRNNTGGGDIGTLSPNGRIMTFADKAHSHVKVFNTETGEEIAQIQKTREWKLHWLGNEGAIYVKDGEYKTFLIDFASGTESELGAIRGEVYRLFPMPSEKNKFVIGTNNTVAKVEISRKDGQLKFDILSEKKIEGRSWTRNMTGQTSNYRYLFNGEQSGLVITNAETLEQEKIEFGPGAFIHGITATADPDKILIRTNAATPRDPTRQTRDSIYSISDKTLAVLEIKDLGNFPIFAPSIKALMSGSGRLDVIDLPSAEPAVSVEQIAAERRQIETDRKLAEADRQLGLVPGYPGLPSTQKGSIYPAPAPSSVALSSPLGSLVGDARLEAVGVYQATNPNAHPGEPRKTGIVEVKVRRTDKPIVLVLSSYEPVRWMLISEPGARLAAVLLSGYHQSSVVGAGSSRIVNLGQKFAYNSNSNEYKTLDEEVMRMTGRRIQMMQGRYEGSAFSVGGPL